VKHVRNSTLAVCLALAWIPAQAQPPYQPTAESLRSHKVPQWFEDAKFGIFIHWDPMPWPAFHEWYVAWMSPKAAFGFLMGGPPFTATAATCPMLCSSREFPRLRGGARLEVPPRQLGPKFAYDDFILCSRPRSSTPPRGRKLFQAAGARYVVLTAKHGDEFAMWPTRHARATPVTWGQSGTSSATSPAPCARSA